MQKSIHTKRQERLRALLKAARKKAGLTQDELAERMGAYKTFVSKYERGERQLDVVEFIAVAEALKLDPRALIDQVMWD
ncbi:helix-turn-helix transcriptional regulator [Microvirga sp. 3-52]|jgi:transcriptional regulator with XRE-family HTH domain|uniref:helix-turn-helix domain-containing protein n=1 Tax=Microvirga sp. 3-52 TaxID=2792425 RepID=UPI001ACE4D90|nr:helix-turn-helix transcriptional regulator [Microvirga sp. 3-52]MBO1903654.1 helix-turn-helix transcriptional regulator [Microvirga sp. 3-52]MBS7450757.1 helix-turn-helix transcriptional regulator [Microvirga sp. 3-52]